MDDRLKELITGNYLGNERALRFADYQLELADKLMGEGKDLSDSDFPFVSFLHSDSGQVVVHPFYDETLRFSVNPVEYYGKEIFDEFCERCARSLAALAVNDLSEAFSTCVMAFELPDDINKYIVGREGIGPYPFDASFDEVNLKVMAWAGDSISLLLGKEPGNEVFKDKSGNPKKSGYQELVDKQVDRAVENSPYYFDKDNIHYLYADSKDSLKGADLLNTLSLHKNDEELMSFFYDVVTDIFSPQIFEIENNIMMEEAIDLIQVDLQDARVSFMSRYTIAPPVEHYMNQEVKLNIMLGTADEKGYDYGLLKDQYTALTRPYRFENADKILSKDSSLVFLLEQQGYSMEDLQETMDEYNEFFYGDTYPSGRIRDHFGENGRLLNREEKLERFIKSHNPFLTSLCEELEHQHSVGVMTVLVKMPVRDFIEMQRGNKEITIDKGTQLGILIPGLAPAHCLA